MTDSFVSEPIEPAALTPVRGTYAIDTEASQFRLRAKAFTRFWVRGTMPIAEGSVRFADGRVSGDGQIGADRLSTGLAARDWHLRSSHYLHTARHPQIHVSVQETPVGGPFECTVVVRGTSCTVPLTIDVVELDEEVLRVTGHLLLDRRPLPMLPPSPASPGSSRSNSSSSLAGLLIDQGERPPGHVRLPLGRGNCVPVQRGWACRIAPPGAPAWFPTGSPLSLITQ